MNDAKVLVTGAGGFLGRNLVDHLVQEKIPTLAVSRNFFAISGELNLLPLNLTDWDSITPLVEALDQCSVALFLAAKTPTDNDYSGVYKDTVLIDSLCCEAFTRSKCPKAIYVSGLTVLDFRSEELRENSERNPKTEYTRAKSEGELRFLDAQRRSGKEVSIVRVNAPYGPGMPDNAVVSLWLRSALAGRPIYVHGNGQRKQIFTWIDDCSKALLISCGLGSGTYHFCGPDHLKMLDVARLFCNLTGSNSEIIMKPEIREDLSCPSVSVDSFENIFPLSDRTCFEKGAALFAEFLSNPNGIEECSP